LSGDNQGKEEFISFMESTNIPEIIQSAEDDNQAMYELEVGELEILKRVQEDILVEYGTLTSIGNLILDGKEFGKDKIYFYFKSSKNAINGIKIKEQGNLSKNCLKGLKFILSLFNSIIFLVR